MAKFCRNCGRPLEEGEVCTCNAQQNGVNRSQPEQNNTRMDEKTKGVPRLLVPIGQTVAGGILVLFGLMTGSFDWSYMSYVAGAGFLLTGICGLVDAKK